MWPFTRIAQWWRRRQRTIDRKVLFPLIRGHQDSEEHGTLVILKHVESDRAWRFPNEWIDEPLEDERQG